MKEINYQAIFLNNETVQKLRKLQDRDLGQENGGKYPIDTHCTFKFKPTKKEAKKFNELVAKKQLIELKIVGYACDGKNSGFEVELPDEAKEAYSNSHLELDENGNKISVPTIPHITVSMSKDGKAVDTGMLDFKKLDAPFYISGVPGFFVIDKNAQTKQVAFELPEEYLKDDTDELDFI